MGWSFLLCNRGAEKSETGFYAHHNTLTKAIKFKVFKFNLKSEFQYLSARKKRNRGEERERDDDNEY